MNEYPDIVEMTVIKLIAQAMDVPIFKVDSRADLLSDVGMSNVQFSYLIWSLEDRFNTSFPYNSGSYRTLSSLVEYIKRHDKSP